MSAEHISDTSSASDCVADGLADKIHILLNKMAMNLKTGMGVDEIKSRGSFANSKQSNQWFLSYSSIFVS
jgi:hypothetical protein